MQYDKYHEICSQGTHILTQGTQTKLSTASKDDVLVSFTSTCSLLSTTFTQFLVEVSRILQLPLDNQYPLISVDRLLSEFKERSLELNNIDKTELSFHSPLILTSPESCALSPPLLDRTPGSHMDHSRTPGSHMDHSGTPSPPDSPFLVTSSQSFPFNYNPLTPGTSTPIASVSELQSGLKQSPPRLPVIPVPAKITKELADSTNRITPPLTFNDMSIGVSKRSAFCKPLPKVDSSPTLHNSNQIKREPGTPPETKSESELLDCLQKLQHCYEKYLPPSNLPFSLNNILHDIKPRAPPPPPPPPQAFQQLHNIKLHDMKPLHDFKLSLPPTFQFINQLTDPNLIIKAMQNSNPLLKCKQPSLAHPPLYTTPMKCPYCDLTFHKKSHLSNHLVQLHSCSYHCCRQCKISFPDRQSLEQHQRSHPKQQFQCSGCNLSFKTGSELKRHIKTHTQERAFMCDICGSRFNLKHNLKAHMRQHTGERPFRCKICNRGFTRSNNLKRHLYAHCQDNAPATTRTLQSDVISMVPNMVMLDGSRLHGIPGMGGELKVD